MVTKFKPTTRANTKDYGEYAIDVSSQAKDIYKRLSPFYEYGNIPHPCAKDMMCISVEAIWQGSKIFSADKIKPDYFVLFGKKSIFKNKGKKPLATWLGGDKYTSDVGDARRHVFVSAYYWTLDNYCKTPVDRLLYFAHNAKNKNVYLYDFGSNFDIDEPMGTFSHSAVLCDYLNEKYNDKKYMDVVIKKYDKKGEL